MSIVELRESLQRDLGELSVSCLRAANARDLAYEAEEARLLGLRVRG